MEITLILAATRDMGIGRAGTLPWTGLRREMAYFAKVTKAKGGNTYPNAVIMGRKTWDSIPPRFRPLADRLNVVISRSAPAFQTPKPDIASEPVFASSLEDALAHLQQASTARKVFVIGGGQIYGAALALAQTRRVLLTKVLTDFDCDTFFPLKLGEGETPGWKRSSHAELEAWTGVEVPEGVQEENGTEYEFQMWERVD